MDELIKELEIAIKNKLFLTSINTALLIPDICSALQSSNGRTDGKKYSNWFNEFIGFKYYNKIIGTDVWNLRCSMLHQGKSKSDNSYAFFESIFFQPSSVNLQIHNVTVGTYGAEKPTSLTINIEIFIKDMIDGYYEWKAKMNENPFYEKNLKNSIQYYPDGIQTQISGTKILT